MFITTLYGSAYSAESEFIAHIDVASGELKIRVDLSKETTNLIHEICRKAFYEKQEALANELRSATLLPKMLAAPINANADEEYAHVEF